jgi:peptidoglycan-associated lipoprotein
MKLPTLTKLLVIGLLLAVATIGCRKRPGYVTDIPGARTQNPGFENSAPPINTNGLAGGEGVTEHPVTDPDKRKDWPRDREIFKAYTVYFDFDSSTVKPGEKSKAAAVADYLKQHPQAAVEIEGHCDERGTEEYNRSLGERRALAVREELISLGIDPNLIDTKTLGKDRPADAEHNEAAYRKNRRGEFLLETPPK